MTSTTTDRTTRSSSSSIPTGTGSPAGPASCPGPAGRHRRATPQRRTRAAALRLAVWLTAWSAAWFIAATTQPASARRHERAQSTVEYALILLGAAAIALVVVAWVTRSDAIGRLFDTVLARVLQQAG